MAYQSTKKNAKNITKVSKAFNKKINKLKSDFESKLKVNTKSKGLYLKNDKVLSKY